MAGLGQSAKNSAPKMTQIRVPYVSCTHTEIVQSNQINSEFRVIRIYYEVCKIDNEGFTWVYIVLG